MSCQSAVGGSHWCYFTPFGCHVLTIPRVSNEKLMLSMGVWARNTPMMVFCLQIAPWWLLQAQIMLVDTIQKDRLQDWRAGWARMAAVPPLYQRCLVPGQWCSIDPSRTSSLGYPGSCCWFKSACGSCHVFSWMLGLWNQMQEASWVEEQVACKIGIHPLGRSCDRYPSVCNPFLEKNSSFLLGRAH